MLRRLIILAAIFGGTGIALGAFGAHGLQKLTSDEKILHAYQTAVEYQVYHALALLGLAAIADRLSNSLVKWSANCFAAGIVFFSGSLYALTAIKISGNESLQKIGVITPIGGLLFLMGWLLLLLAALKRKDHQSSN